MSYYGKQIFFALIVFLMINSCENIKNVNEPDGKDNSIDYANIPVFSPNDRVNVVVEIPAGTNHKIEYNYAEKKFKVDQKNGRDRVVDFLPYPGNYGFIPSTYMTPGEGGDGDALDVLVIAESIPTGTVVEVVPIAVALFLDNGEIDNKIIAVPADSLQRIIKAFDYNGLETNYPNVKAIIADWFLNYKGGDEMQLESWEDEIFAMEEIRKWMVE